MSEIVVDTTVIIAVIANEASKSKIIDATLGATLVAPSSLDVEIGNAFSRMFKRQRIELGAAEKALSAHRAPGSMPASQNQNLEVAE